MGSSRATRRSTCRRPGEPRCSAPPLQHLQTGRTLRRMDPTRTTHGTISLVIPPAWRLAPDDGPDTRRWLLAPATGESPAGMIVLQTIGALPEGGPTIEARLHAAVGALGATAGVEVTAEARRVVLGT